MSFRNVGKVWSRQSFKLGIAKPDWVKGITLHHTGAPSLQTRPNGFTMQHIENIRDFYIGKGWKSGPHLFTDDDGVFGMTPFNEKGVHASSFNSTHFSIETLGDYDAEKHDAGRGLECWITTAYAVRALRAAWGPLPLNLHRDDPRTSKTCAGAPVTVAWVEQLVKQIDGGAVPQVSVEDTLGTKFVPVMAYIAEARPQLKPQLSRRGAQTYLNEWRLETAHYDTARSATMASEYELLRWLAAQ